MAKLGDPTDFSYRVNKVTKVIDGDTIDVIIDLGFDIMYKSRVRLFGIDTPESRTRDLVEKKFGKASKKHLKGILEQGGIELVSHDKGKFGRILGEFFIGNSEVSVNQQMINDHHAVAYTGGNKEEIEKGHLANREILLEQGVVEL